MLDRLRDRPEWMFFRVLLRASPRLADVTVVLDGAHVVEVGSHDELMSRGGQYAELCSIQAAGFR